MRRHLFLYISILFSSGLFSQSDTLWIPEIEISTKRTPEVYSESSRIITILTKAEIESAPVQSLVDLLEYVMNVDIRQRGYNGVQSDISIRGGSFDQTLILVNGIPFNDPQTGHHNADLPIDIDNIDRIEILEGPASRTFGPNAFSGAINIITGLPETNTLKLSLTGGENNLYGTSAALNTSNKSIANSLSISKKGSDGYIENTDYQMLNLFYLSRIKLNNATLDLQAAHQDKSFGANSFYTPKYPDQYVQTKTEFISASLKGGAELKHKTSVYWKQHNGQFELVRGNPLNYHQTQVYGIDETINFHSKMGKTAVGFSYRHEKILSNVLGFSLDEPKSVKNETDVFYTKSDKRNNYSFFIEHSYYSKRTSFSAGLLANYNSVFDWHFAPGIDFGYNFTNHIKFFASINKSFRLPTFTDLYYEGPTNVGNADLIPEEAISFEAGLKFIQKDVAAEMAIFKRDGTNIIDWVKYSDTQEKWESKNITELNTSGFEFAVHLNSSFFSKQNLPINQFKLSYAFTNVSKKGGDFTSKYALDYLKHKLALNLSHNIYKSLSMNWQATYQDRAGTYLAYPEDIETEYNPFVLLDAKMNWEIQNWDVYLEVANLFDANYFDIGNVIMPGRWVKMGVSIDINLSK
ncbi:MAG: TonB-dependent receptor [Bacteroidetes bacterium]|nr:TonB-dependent receptor [Bacteroidota bacterium]